MHKKASLNLSIQAIVIIVLAMTLLGLGLGFVRTQFEQFTDTTLTVQEQTRQGILDDLRVGNKKLSFPTERIKATPGSKKDLAIGIKNTEDEEIKFKIKIEQRQLSADATTTSFVPLTSGTDGTGFFWDDSEQRLGPGESRVYGVLHTSESSKDTYLYKIRIVLIADDQGTEGDDFDSKTFFVTVA
jgi:hypothetical protein